MLAQVVSETRAMLMSGCLLPLPGDWCMRVMEWVRWHVFKGIIDNKEDNKEIELFDASEGGQVTDGVIRTKESYPMLRSEARWKTLQHVMGHKSPKRSRVTRRRRIIRYRLAQQEIA